MSSKAREALNQLLGLIDNEILVFNESLEPSEISQAQYHIDKAVEAYEDPLRNCDVGTPEEQSVRMSEFCREQYEKSDGIMLCSGCRFHGIEGLDCQLAWAQMPYESEVTK